jgi:hypothetical protein
MRGRRQQAVVALALVLGLVLGAFTGREPTASEARSDTLTLELAPELEGQLRGGTVLFGQQITDVAGRRITLDVADDRVGIVEALSPEGDVVATRIVVQSDDWSSGPGVVDLRSTAAAAVLTMPGVASADPYIDALLLAAIETSPVLDEIVQRIARAQQQDPGWYAQRWDIIGDLVPPLLADAMGALASDFGVDLAALEAQVATGPVAASPSRPAQPGPAGAAGAGAGGAGAAAGGAGATAAGTAGAAGRSSCDGAAMGDLDGFESDGVCFFPISAPVEMSAEESSQMFTADNQTARWVIVYAGDPVTPVALIPPRRWSLPHVRVLLAAISEAAALTGFEATKLRLEAVGLEYRRDSATFWQQLQLRLRPYAEAPLTTFTVPGPLLTGGIATVTFGFPPAEGLESPQLLLGGSVALLLTLTTEFVAPTFAIALNLRRGYEKTELKELGEGAPADSCLAGLEPSKASMGGSLLDVLTLPTERQITEDEQVCRVNRAVRMSLLDEALAFARDQQQVLAVAEARLAGASLSQSLSDVAEAAISAIQAVAIGGLTNSRLLTQILSVDLLGDDIGKELRANIPEAVLAEGNRVVRVITKDAFLISIGRAPVTQTGSTNPLQELKSLVQLRIATFIAEQFLERVVTQIGKELLNAPFAAIAAINRIETVANQAIDVASIFLTGRQLFLDLRGYGTFDRYAPVMIGPDGELTGGSGGWLPDILWTVSTGFIPDDRSGLVTGDGYVHVVQSDISRADYGRRASIDVAGTLAPRPTGTLTDTSVIIEFDGVRHTLALADLLTRAGFEPERHARVLRDLAFYGPIELKGLQLGSSAYAGGKELITFALVGARMPLFDFPQGGLAVVMGARDGGVITALWDDALLQIDTPRQGELTLHTMNDGGWLIKQFTLDGRRLRSFGPDGTTGLRRADTTPERSVFRRDRTGTSGSASITNYGPDSPLPRWRVTDGTACALVDGGEASAETGQTCRRVARWFVAQDLAIGAYIQGGFEVRTIGTGNRIVVDATEYGAEITAIAVQLPLLFIGDGHGRVRMFDLSAASGDITGRQNSTIIRIGDGQELLPISELAVRGSELYIVSNTSRRLYRYSEGPDGWAQDWLLAVPDVAQMRADATGAYVLMSDGKVMAVR